MSSSGPIRKLPVELLHDIVQRLRDANKLASLAAFGQTCRGFWEIIDHYLWHHPQAEEPEVFYWGCRYGREAVVRRLLTFNDGPPTGNRIRELNHGLGLPHTSLASFQPGLLGPWIRRIDGISRAWQAVTVPSRCQQD